MLLLEDLWPGDVDYDVFRRAVYSWGEEAQFLMAVEECGELISAIAQSYRNRDDVDLVGEVADVFIMASQLSCILGPGNVELAVKQKIAKLESLLAKSEDGDA